MKKSRYSSMKEMHSLFTSSLWKYILIFKTRGKQHISQMNNSTVCLDIPNSVLYVIVIGAIAAIIGTISNVFGMSCPFVSNILQNRIHTNNTGLLVHMNEQLQTHRNNV